jgi:prepilin-type N-terminal cleavage/methylation domain-containing protein
MQLRSPTRFSRLASIRDRATDAGFTLTEIVIALAVLATMAAGCYIGFNSLNTYAISSRLYTEAQAVAQNRIDMILSKGPFDPKNNKIPTVLQIGATTTPNVFI